MRCEVSQVVTLRALASADLPALLTYVQERIPEGGTFKVQGLRVICTLPIQSDVELI